MTEGKHVRREKVQGEEELLGGLKERRRWQVTGKEKEGGRRRGEGTGRRRGRGD